MKKIGLLLAVLLLFGEAFAQKCKFDEDETDPMTEVRFVRNYIKHKNYLKMAYYRKGETNRVEMYATFVGERNFMVLAGTELSLKLGDGTIETFELAQDASPTSFVSPGATQVMTSYALSFSCTEEQIRRLSKHGYTVLRTKLGDFEITHEVKAKRTKETAEKAACMLAI